MSSNRSSAPSGGRTSTSAIHCSSDRLGEQLERVIDGERLARLLGVRGDLDRAARVGRGDRRGAGGAQVRDLAAAELRGRLGLGQVVDAGRSAADLPPLGVDDLEAGDALQQIARLGAYVLRVREVARVVVGDLVEADRG